ncbi:MAG: type I DNA topoisomerase [Candidatus Berkelbacteria bacterium]|nr:type I DNA topoisomerase [Candidatus Berkelbacteria bacterium]
MNLLIVESPAKARTIEGYLGGDFRVLSSYGHIRDLPPKKLGVDINNDYQPEYQILSRAKANLAIIKEALKKADKIYLATDYDREGEAIAWHLIAALNLTKNKSKVLRITFNEITKNAIQDSIKKPRKIDINLVNAQQARRILDRLVGYKLSPFLWKKITRGLSAGRVQSVAVRLIVERERKIENFKSDEYWEVIANLTKKKDDNLISERANKGSETLIKAKLTKSQDKPIKKLDIKGDKEAEKIKNDLEGAKYKISNIKDKEREINPFAPYRTATLQQDAARKLKYSAKKTMFVAQRLYEGVDLGDDKRVGLITYMRTDSTNLSVESVKKARDYIEKSLGEDYLPKTANIYKTKNLGAQEAHEAVRPTDPSLEPSSLKKYLSRDEWRLYELIWRRMIASQCESAKIFDRIIEIEAKEYGFEARGRTIKFPGFLSIYSLGLKDAILPKLKIGEILDLKSLDLNQKFTQPPARYSEATLVKELERRGIGRPSTYAPIMSTIEDRHYVKKVDGYFHPVEVGIVVNDVLVEHFPEVVDYNFTARMEGDLDKIADGKLDWIQVIDEFYKPFSKHLEAKEKTVKKEDVAHQKTGRKCPECKKDEIVIKIGRFGRFYACSEYPQCKYKEKMEKKEVMSLKAKKLQKKAQKLLKKNLKCAKCGADMAVRTSRYGTFLGCTNYPKCRNIIAVEEDSNIGCPKCKEGRVVRRFTRKGKIFWGCSRYPDCDFASWSKPVATKEQKNGRTKEQ